MKKFDGTNGTYGTYGIRRFFIRPIGLICLIGPILFSTTTQAQTTPSPVQTSIGTACTGKANSADFDAIAQCNTTTMQRAPYQMGKVTTPPYANTTCNADKAGMMQWTGNYMAVCDGATWMKMTTSIYDPSCDDPNPAIGTICDDGTIYAGLTPDGNVKMFMSPCDEGRVWDQPNKTCAEQPYPVNFPWQSGASGTGVVTGVTNPNTGQANTAVLLALTAAPGPYLAAQRCANSTANGHTDWYLPASFEMSILIANTNLYGYHWTSTEATAQQALNSHTGPTDKSTGSWIRCIRKGT